MSSSVSTTNISSHPAQPVEKAIPRIRFAPEPVKVGKNAHARSFSRAEYLEREMAPYLSFTSRQSTKTDGMDVFQTASMREAVKWMTQALGRRKSGH
jgi:hypothetical protein